MLCPACSFENLPGADVCTECQTDLTNVREHPLDPVEMRFRDDRMRQLIRREPMIANADETVRSVIDRFSEAGRNCAVVVDGDQVVGILTERDILRKVALEYEAAKDRPVSEYMTAGPESLTADDSLAQAINKMAVGGYRHIPITDEAKKPLGVVSVKAVMAHLTKTMPEVFGS